MISVWKESGLAVRGVGREVIEACLVQSWVGKEWEALLKAHPVHMLQLLADSSPYCHTSS